MIFTIIYLIVFLNYLVDIRKNVNYNLYIIILLMFYAMVFRFPIYNYAHKYICMVITLRRILSEDNLKAIYLLFKLFLKYFFKN